jgi:hypothetical protein
VAVFTDLYIPTTNLFVDEHRCRAVGAVLLRIIFCIHGIFCSLAQLQRCPCLMNTHFPGGTLTGPEPGVYSTFARKRLQVLRT